MYKKISTNNLQTYLIELPKKTKRWHIKLEVSAGYLAAPKNKREIPHLLEHYLFRCLEKAKLHFNATTDFDSVVFSIKLPPKSAVTKLTSFLSILLQNKVDDAALFSLEKKVWQNEHLGNLDNPERLARRIGINSLIKDKPYALEYTEITLKDIRDFYNRVFLNSKICLFIGTHQIAKLPISSIKQVIASYDINKPKRQAAKFKYLPSKKVNHLFDTHRTNICLTWPAPEESCAPIEHISMMLIISLLCDSKNGLLWEILQDKYGLIYDLEYCMDDCLTFGYFVIQIATLNEDAPSCIELILDEIDKLKSGRNIGKTRLQKLILSGKADNRKTWADNESRFDWVAADLINGEQVINLTKWLGYYRQVTPILISSTAKKYLANNLQIIKMGRSVNSPHKV